MLSGVSILAADQIDASADAQQCDSDFAFEIS
jgi:hypothetical protein